MKYIQQNIKAIILGLIIAVGVSYAYAANFEGPKCAPPDCNTDAPLNVGIINQGKQAGLVLSPTEAGVTEGLSMLDLKLASLVVDGILSTDGAQINGGLILRDGTQSDGRILVSDPVGNASWKSLASLSQTCDVNITSNLGVLTGNTGNNRTSIKLVNILEPGTYTFTGSGQSQNQGGGGIDSYFYSSTLYPSGDIANPEISTNLPVEVRPYFGYTDTNKPDEVYYAPAGSSIVYAVKRYGQTTPKNWSIPTNTTITLTSSKYLYTILGQASENGFVYITGTKSNCGGISGISSSFQGSKLLLNSQTTPSSTAGASMSGTFTVPTGVSRVKLTLQGAGAGANNTDGGAGGYCVKYLSVTAGATIPYTVGTAGAGGVTGGNTTFNSSIVANGGRVDTSGTVQSPVAPGNFGGGFSGCDYGLTSTLYNAPVAFNRLGDGAIGGNRVANTFVSPIKAENGYILVEY